MERFSDFLISTTKILTLFDEKYETTKLLSDGSDLDCGSQQVGE